MRWTAPMNAPSPPPTMPMRSLRFQDSIIGSPREWRSACRLAARRSRALGCASRLNDSQSKHLAVAARVGLAADEIVEGHLSRVDQVTGDERGTFDGALLGAFDAALP